MNATRRTTLARLFAFGFLCCAVPLLANGCGEEAGKLKPDECSKLRSDAYQVIKLGQPCNTDADCKESTFPECRKPLNTKSFEQIAELEKKHAAGKCKDDSAACKDSPPVYCKQGLCTMKEPGTVRD